jgi:hypothetical protein
MARFMKKACCFTTLIDSSTILTNESRAHQQRTVAKIIPELLSIVEKSRGGGGCHSDSSRADRAEMTAKKIPSYLEPLFQYHSNGASRSARRPLTKRRGELAELEAHSHESRINLDFLT